MNGRITETIAEFRDKIQDWHINTTTHHFVFAFVLPKLPLYFVGYKTARQETRQASAEQNANQYKKVHVIN